MLVSRYSVTERPEAMRVADTPDVVRSGLSR